ncbi:MAG: hypothetical protein R3250_07880 [Melioribacteraceae bacterium]|nr:hypothetical protein [Melioribacteraceae bacterium]
MFEGRYNLFLLSIVLFSLFFISIPLWAQSGTVKYIYTLDYPMGEKAEYLEWIKSISGTLQEPEELLSIASYDNYLKTSPQRYIEFVFANAADATAYFENPKINRIVEELVNHGINVDIHLIKRRGDYSIKNLQRRAIKYVFNLDYGLRGKDDYIRWVKSITDVLQKPEEIRKIASFDNYFNASPNRFIEFEFDSMEDAIKYFDRSEVNEVIEMSTEKSINHTIKVLSLRGDYYSSQHSNDQ